MIRIEHERCVRARSPRASCASCARACPRDALAIEPLPAADARCDGCGICAASCPTDAIALDEPLRFPGEVALDARGSRTISCAAVDEAGAEVPCLASLRLVPLVALACEAPVRLVRGDCSRCERASESATSALSARIAVVDEHVEGVEIVVEVAGPRRSAPELGKAGQSRRALFGSLLRPRRESARAAGREVDLHAALAGRDVRIPSSAELSFRFAAPPSCDGCGVCADLCPTQALEARSSGETRSLSFDPARCCGCGLCVDVCNEGARIEAADWTAASSGPEEIVLLTRRECADCGFDVFVHDGDPRSAPLCFVCIARRQREQGASAGGKVALRTLP